MRELFRKYVLGINEPPKDLPIMTIPCGYRLCEDSNLDNFLGKIL